jgi:hypothetical protein
VSINGINGAVGGLSGYSPLVQRPAGGPSERTGSAVSLPVEPDASPSAVRSPEHALPEAAPAGVDPALWSVLSSEERQFFSRVTAMGPLTYGPRSANIPPGMMRGGRLDRMV